jgi:hypothetical protein
LGTHVPETLFRLRRGKKQYSHGGETEFRETSFPNGVWERESIGVLE